MKKILFGALLLLTLPFIAVTSVANAQTFRSSETAKITSNENIDGMTFITGSSVIIAGTVNGDVYCAGQNVTIKGTVNGDILCAGQTVVLSGTVTGDVRLAGQTITMSGDIQGNVTAAGQTLALNSSSKVGSDAVLFGQTITVDGPVARDIVLSSASATINSTVGRNVTADAEYLTLGSNALVAGTLTYTSQNTLTQDAGATVKGKVTHNVQKLQQTTENKSTISLGFGIGLSVLWTVMLIVSALIIALLFPRELHRATDESLIHASKALLAVAVGFVAGIVMPFAILFLMITVFGLPIALILFLAWALILALSGAFSAYYLGRIILRTKHNAILIMLVGAIVLAVVFIVPILGIFVGLLSTWYGSGILLLQVKRYIVTPHYDMQSTVRSRKK